MIIICFLPFRLNENENPNIQIQNKVPYYNGGLCGMPYRILRKQALDVQLNLKQSDDQSSHTRISSDQSTVEITGSKIIPDSNNNDNLLWVEKFRPRNFLELLSDDGTNRTLLKWLKLWDKVVFNKEIKLKTPQNEQSESNKTNEPIVKTSPTEVNKIFFLSNGERKRKSQNIFKQINIFF